ncbi:MAG: hypothetical protein HY328_03970 [Chloroflexi bacterium]|nr:hypothetical protein [Chloroflexota bacterium]
MNNRRMQLFALGVTFLALLGLFVAMPALLTSGVAATAGAGTLVLVAPTGQVTVGNTVQVTAQMQGVSGPLSAAQAEVVYNPAVLEFRSVAPAGFLSSTGRQVVCPPPAQSSGRARFVCASAGPNAGPTGSGPLVTITFGAVGAGQSNLSLEGISLINSSRPPAAISSSTQSAQVTVAPQAPVETEIPLWLPLVNR